MNGYNQLTCYKTDEMDMSPHNITTLFQQLGLPSDDDEIDSFCAEHTLERGIRLVDADFWTVSQSAFLSEALEDDSDWAEIVDQLDVRLRP